MEVDLKIDLPIDQCRAILEDSIDPERYFPLSDLLLGAKGVKGYVRGSKFRIRKRRENANSMAPVVYGEFLREGEATRVRGEFRTYPWVKPFTRLWFGMVVAFLIIGSAVFLWKIYSREVKYVDALLPTVPIFLIIFGHMLDKWCVSSSQHEKEYLLNFLKQLYGEDGGRIPSS